MILPAVGSIRRISVRTSVDLPEPERPMTTNTSPGQTSIETSRTAIEQPVFSRSSARERSASGVPTMRSSCGPKIFQTPSARMSGSPEVSGTMGVSEVSTAAVPRESVTARMIYQAEGEVSRSAREAAFPLGAAATLEELEADPHPLLAGCASASRSRGCPRSRPGSSRGATSPCTSMRDAETFTVDDPRFSTGAGRRARACSRSTAPRIARHRDPFARPFRLDAVRERFTAFVEAETDALLEALRRRGEAELRRALRGPARRPSMAHVARPGGTDAATVLGWYERSSTR